MPQIPTVMSRATGTAAQREGADRAKRQETVPKEEANSSRQIVVTNRRHFSCALSRRLIRAFLPVVPIPRLLLRCDAVQSAACASRDHVRLPITTRLVGAVRRFTRRLRPCFPIKFRTKREIELPTNFYVPAGDYCNCSFPKSKAP
jgi:hypothetical protein